MDFKRFLRVVRSFADDVTDMDVEHGTLVVQVRDELIEAHLAVREGELLVEEADQTVPARLWLANRLARIPLLADRILAYVPPTDNFVLPAGRLLDEPNLSRTLDEETSCDATHAVQEILGRHTAGTTSVLYLTSDAGEGKTTLISHLARTTAQEFKDRRRDWLLVPIPLGGRTFLRFDDVVIAALVNRLRFQFFYFEAFLELVRLGFIVPAFDGFEEMIIESSAGEAVSALGGLVTSLESEGSVLVAARRAFFDYRSFRTQAKLLDAIGGDVAFSRLALDRWSRSQFLEYSRKRAVRNAEALHAAIASRLTENHPLLTRAVLVRRLVDVALESTDVTALLDQIGRDPHDYFFQFVNAIVEREAIEKWIDRSGDPSRPLLTVDEHHALLALLAQEMWLSSSDALRSDLVGVVADVFCETTGKPPAVARQIRDRLKQHSLVASLSGPGSPVSFDHEDFRVFYLGEAVGQALIRDCLRDGKPLLQIGALPRATVDGAVLHIRRTEANALEIVRQLGVLAVGEGPASFVRENCGGLALALVGDQGLSDVELSSMAFPAEALRGLRLSRVTVRDSYFHPTSLESVQLEDCRFVRCRFERIDLPSLTKLGATLEDCEIGSVFLWEPEAHAFDPRQIAALLSGTGLTIVEQSQIPLSAEIRETDEDLRLLEKLLRLFMRATQINESVLRTKLGKNANYFLDELLPRLKRAGVVDEVAYVGKGSQKRFRMGRPMSQIQEALARCNGSVEEFLEFFGGA